MQHHMLVATASVICPNLVSYYTTSFVYSWFLELLSLLHIHSKTWILAYFEPKNCTLKLKLLFYLIYDNQLFSEKKQSTESLILHLFCPWKYEKRLPNVGYTKLTWMPKHPNSKIHFFKNMANYRPTVHKTWTIPLDALYLLTSIPQVYNFYSGVMVLLLI